MEAQKELRSQPPPYESTFTEESSATQSRKPAGPTTAADFDIKRILIKNGMRTYMSHYLTHDPEALRHWIVARSRSLPRPIVRVCGSHKKLYNSGPPTIVGDFDFSIPLQERLAVPWRRMYIRPWQRRSTSSSNRDVEAGEDSDILMRWCKDLCTKKWIPKEFMMSYAIIDPDQAEIRRRIEGILRDTDYCGQIDITFEKQESTTVLVSGHWINRLRRSRIIWWICVVSQLWIITWPLIWMCTKKWEFVKVKWPTKIHRTKGGHWPIQDEFDPSSIHDGRTVDSETSKVARLTAASWVTTWRPAIETSALRKSWNVRLANSDFDQANKPWIFSGGLKAGKTWGRAEHVSGPNPSQKGIGLYA